METIISIVQTILDAIKTNEKVGLVLAYIVGVYVIITAVKAIAALIIKFTKSEEDDKWFDKWIVKPWDSYVEPILALFPHSSIKLNKYFEAVVKGATYIVKWLQGKK